MTEISDLRRHGAVSRLADLLAGKRAIMRDYLAAISGSAGRLVFSLVYFVALANTLTIAEFGVFATASAAGVMLSRIVAFGFISTLYRIAAVRPRMVGTFTAGFLVMAGLSLPVLVAASALTYAVFFAPEMTPSAFALVVAAEALLWRPFELVVIVNNGLGQFGRAAVLVIAGTLFRAGAALALVAFAAPSLQDWVWLYLCANALALAVAAASSYPRQRLRFRPRLYWRRLPDALYVAGAEVLFYLQMEFDKLVVLAVGGPKLAGLYAIVMRLVDLTAIPIRTFTMMLVQRMMRTPEMLAGLSARAGIEAAVFVVSTAALAVLALSLHVFPTLLGRNVAEAAPLVMLVMLVPGLRNLSEYQAELLFARGHTGVRAGILALLGGLKVLLLYLLLSRGASEGELMLALNGVFLALYLVSAALTYAALRRPAKTF